MTYVLFGLLACSSKESDTSEPTDTAQSNEPSGEPGGEPGNEPGNEPGAPEPGNEPGNEPGGEPSGEPGVPEPSGDPVDEDPDDFPTTCSSASMGNTAEVHTDEEDLILTEAIWDIEQFGFMTIVMGLEGSSLCDAVLAGTYSNDMYADILLEGEGMLLSTQSYSLSATITDGEPGNGAAAVSFVNGANIELFNEGSLDISSYTYGADLIFSLSVGDSEEYMNGSNIKACYCPGALEIIANF